MPTRSSFWPWLIPWVEDRALKRRGQEPGVEVVEPAGRDQPAIQDDEPRQVGTLRAQAVAEPRAHAGPALESRAGV